MEYKNSGRQEMGPEGYPDELEPESGMEIKGKIEPDPENDATYLLEGRMMPSRRKPEVLDMTPEPIKAIPEEDSPKLFDEDKEVGPHNQAIFKPNLNPY